MKMLSRMLGLGIALLLVVGCTATTTEPEQETPDSSQESELPPLTGDGPPQVDADTSWVEQKELDIAYGDLSESQVLDIYYPNETLSGTYPTLVYIHGGAFKFGDKKGNILDEVLQGLERGYVVVSINYRMSGEAIFPAAVEDCKLAIRYLKANAEAYHIDVDNIVAWGESAGGNLASMLGVTGDITDYDAPELGYEAFDSTVKGVVDWFGPLDFLAMDEDFATLNIDPVFGPTSVESSPESAYIGQLITEATEQTRLANPMNYISEGDAKFLIQHGNADRNVPYVQSERFAEALRNVLGESAVTIKILDGGMHGDDIPEATEPKFGTEENMDYVFSWLDTLTK